MDAKADADADDDDDGVGSGGEEGVVETLDGRWTGVIGGVVVVDEEEDEEEDVSCVSVDDAECKGCERRGGDGWSNDGGLGLSGGWTERGDGVRVNSFMAGER